MVYNIFFCSESPDILDKAGRKTRRGRTRRTQAIPKRYLFHAIAINLAITLSVIQFTVANFLAFDFK